MKMRLENHLGEIAAEKGLSEAEVASRVSGLLGRPLDPRTLRRYLSGEPIADPSVMAVVAISRALGTTVDSAVGKPDQDSLEEILRRAGIGFIPARKHGPLPEDFFKVDPAWGDLVGPFLEERHREDL